MTAATTSAATAANAPSRRIGFAGERRRRQACELERLTVVDAEGGRVEQRRKHRLVGRRKAVEAPFFEPVDLLGGDLRAPGRFVDRQLPVKPHARER